MTEPLPAEDVVTAESPIGIVPFAEFGTTAAVDVPSKGRLLDGIGLMAPPPAGDQVDDPDVVRRVSDELTGLLGGWFDDGVSTHLRLHDSLVSTDVRNHYAGFAMDWDEPGSGAFSWLAFRSPPWQVQAVGDAGAFHCVSFGHPLAEAAALGDGGHPRRLPVGPPLDLLAEAAPHSTRRDFEDESKSHPKNVFDTYLTAEGMTVKGGVRMRTDQSGALLGYFYGIRIVARVARP